MAGDTTKSGFFAYTTVSKQKGGGLLPALRHNKRELPERGHIDHQRSHLNYAITPTQSATEAHKQVLKRYIDLDIKPRANASEAIEVVFSLPTSWHDRDNSDYFFACYEAVTVIFGGELISFDVHLDESAPHAHALILPILDGRLNAREILGGLGNLRRFRSEFNRLVGIPYNLPIKNGLNKAQKDALARAIIKHMEAIKDPAIKSPT